MRGATALAAVLGSGSRGRIFAYLAANPGVHVRRIGRALGMSTGLLSHHLAVLENRGLVRAEADGHRKRYFPANAFAPEERRILAMLRQRVPRRVLSALVEHGLRTFAELQAATEVSKSTLSYHLKKLRRAGLVLEGRAERGKMYGLRDPDVVARLLRVSEERSGDEVDAFAAGWTEMRA